MGEKSVSIIIPAFNEANTLANIVTVLNSIDYVRQIVVVNDGSQDSTYETARSLGVDVLDLPYNRGKGGALAAGLQCATSPIVMFLDADLIGLQTHHIDALCQPVQEGRLDMTVGVFQEGRMMTDLAQNIAPNLSGQRVVRRHVLETNMDWATMGFGVEVAITKLITSMNIKASQIPLFELTHIIKEEKHGIVLGLLARIKMYTDIFRARKALKR